ncbi:MAG: LysR substrate-binding domain-containing protein [Candidatus Acidiferrales bacterium]
MYPGVELRLLRYVAVLAQELNFTRASDRLRVAQPSLSKQIRELEEYLGVRLFERTKREVRLTAAGEAFTSEARQAILHAERAVEEARSASRQYKGPWSMAYSPLLDLRILSKVRRYLSASHPAAEIRLVSAFTSEQSEGLLEGDLHAGLVILPVCEARLACQRLYREPLILALPTEHPLADKPKIDITDLHDLPLVSMRSDFEPRFGKDLSRIFGMTRTRPRIFHETSTHAEALEFVSEGGLAALTMPSARYPAREGIVFRDFVDEFLTAETALAYLEQEKSPILNSLRGLLAETFQPLASTGRNGMMDGRAPQMALF